MPLRLSISGLVAISLLTTMLFVSIGPCREHTGGSEPR
jgi:hypothetical protein